LYRAKASFFAHPQWAALQDWSATLAPHYSTAESMLGVETVPFDSDGQALLRAMASHYGVESTFRRTPCAVFFGAEGVTVPDPYFGGQGPARTGCTRCGSCTMGCRVGAKNTLVKNYLWFAEKRGVSIRAQTRVRDIRPLGDDSGRDGYVLSTQSCVPWWRGAASASITARGVVVAAGALGTNQLLAYCKHVGGLPRISDHRQGVRTNSESIRRHPAGRPAAAVPRCGHQCQHPRQ
jgi:cholesterol oxidase